MVKKAILVEYASEHALSTEELLRGVILTVLEHEGCKQIKVVSKSGEEQ